MTTTTQNSLLLRILTDLRTALGLDAVVTGLNGLVYLAAAPVLDGVLGMPVGPLRAIGGFLLVYAIAVWAIRTPDSISRHLAYGVVAANVAWAVASIGVALAGWHSPTLIGTIWIVAQAGLVAAFAELQLTGLRRTRND